MYETTDNCRGDLWSPAKNTHIIKRRRGARRPTMDIVFKLCWQIPIYHSVITKDPDQNDRDHDVYSVFAVFLFCSHLITNSVPMVRASPMIRQIIAFFMRLATKYITKEITATVMA